LCEETGYKPGQLIGNLGDVHIYKNHIEQSLELASRDPFLLPKLKVSDVDILNGEFNYELIGYKSHPTIKAELSN
jgi:thymidylate synthase